MPAYTNTWAFDHFRRGEPLLLLQGKKATADFDVYRGTEAPLGMVGPSEGGSGWKRIVGPRLLTLSSALMYAAPVNRRTVVRHIHAYNPGGATVTVTVAIGVDVSATRLYDAYPVAADIPLDEGRKHVLAAGDTIHAWASADDAVVLTITAEELVA